MISRGRKWYAHSGKLATFSSATAPIRLDHAVTDGSDQFRKAERRR